MNKKRLSGVAISLVLLALCGLLAVAYPTRKPEARVAGSARERFGLMDTRLQDPPGEKPVEQVFKNIQILKGLPSSQIYATMNFMRASLDVECEYCHLKRGPGNWDFASDDKPTKGAARRMISMVMDVNRTTFGGTNAVTCFTCHRGQSPPATMANVMKSKAQNDAKAPAIDPKLVGPLPEVEQVLEKYVEALGGKAATERVKTRVIKASITEHLLPTSPLEIFQQSPDKILFVITTPKGMIAESYDGTSGWIADGKGPRRLDGPALALLKFEADFYRDLKLAERYLRMTVAGRDRVRERDAYLIEAVTPEHKTEKLYFDVQSGLLLRRVTFIQTMIGLIPEATDYDDYREIDGVKIAFARHREQLQGFEASTIIFAEVRPNVPVDKARFEMPAAKP